jgi:RHS repeat-associated protein
MQTISRRKALAIGVAVALLLSAYTAWAALSCGTAPDPVECYSWACSAGEWLLKPKSSGTTCNDASACTSSDKCDGAGHCRGTAITINDGNPCTTDSCAASSGVLHVPLPAGTSCTDSNACNGSETCNASGACLAGVSVAVDDWNPCTVDTCDAASGTVTHAPVSGDACCVAGSAAITDDGDPCTADSCDPVDGVRHELIASCGSGGTASQPAVGDAASVAGNPFQEEVPSSPRQGGPSVVEHTGELQYDYAFDLPEARGKYQPKLGLTYRSSAGQDEGYGRGWVLTGAYIDTDPSGALTSTTGPLSGVRYWIVRGADRSRLVATGSGSYKTDIQGDLVSLSRATNGSGWQATDLIGNTYHFDTAYSSNGTLSRWYLSSVTDVFGNLTSFSYAVDAAPAAQLSEIKYNSYELSGTQYATRVRLTYSRLAGPHYERVADRVAPLGSKTLTDVSIEVYDSTTYRKLRSHSLGYVVSPRGAAVLLRSITLGGTINGSWIPPTIFDYDVPSAPAYSLADGVPLTGLSAAAPSAAWMDVDGDGRADRVVSNSWARNISMPATGTATFAPFQPLHSSPCASPMGCTSHWQELACQNIAVSNISTSGLVDMNGDGVLDFVSGAASGDTYGATVYALFVQFGSFDGTALTFAPAMRWDATPARSAYDSVVGLDGQHVAFGYAHYCSWSPSIMLSDVNGDGIQDLVVRAAANAPVFFGYNVGGSWGFAGPATMLGADTYLYPGPADINGDGLLDVFRGPGTMAQFDEGLSLSAALPWDSFESDGVTFEASPVAGWGPPAPVDGRDYTCPPENCSLPQSSWLDPRRGGSYADLDGDHRPELVRRTAQGTSECSSEPCPLFIYWNTGGGFSRGGTISQPRAPGGSAVNMWPESNWTGEPVTCRCTLMETGATAYKYGTRLLTGWDAQFIDLDGDGVADYVMSDADGVQDSGSRVTWTFFRGIATNQALLRTVTTPSGAQYSVGYERALRYGATAQDGSGNVVSYVAVSGPRIASNITRYAYEAPVRATSPLEPARPESRGFATTWSWDENPTTIVKATRWVTTSHALVGSPREISWGTTTGHHLASGAPDSVPFRTVKFGYALRTVAGLCNDDSVDPVTTNYPVTPVSINTESTESLDGVALTSRLTRTCSDVDQYGNVSRETIDPDTSRSGDEVTSFSSFYANAACKTCPVETSKKDALGRYLERVAYFYDSPPRTWASAYIIPNRYLNYTKRWVSRDGGVTGAWEVSSAATYNENGTVASVVTAPYSSSATFTRSYEYDFQNLRVTAETSFDATRALVRAVEYDAYGRPAVVTQPFVSGMRSSAPTRAFVYDAFGRVIAVGRSVSQAGVVSGALLAAAYADTQPPAVTHYTFLSPLSFAAGAVPERPDIKAVTLYSDGLGRVIQARERLGVAGAPDPQAQLSQLLLGYRILRAVKFDAVGRITASLEPAFSSTGTYEDFDTLAAAPNRRGSMNTFDVRGLPACVSTGVFAAVAATASSCSSSFADDSSYRSAVRFAYRGERASGVSLVIATSFPPASSAGVEAAYDSSGKLQWTKDSWGNTTTAAYDPLSRVTSLTRHAYGTSASIDQSIRRVYDTAGRIIEETDPNWGSSGGPSRILWYDSQDHLTRVELQPQPVAGSSVRAELRYEYNSLGRRTRIDAVEPFASTGGGVAYSTRNVATFEYDHPYGNLPRFTNTAGRLSYATSAVTTVALGYDANGRTIRRDQYFAAFGPTPFAQLASYSDDGRFLSGEFSSPVSSTVSWVAQFDSSGRPTRVTVGGTALWEAISASPLTGAYDALDRVAEIRTDSGSVTDVRTFSPYTSQLTSDVIRAGSAMVHGIEGVAYNGAKLSSFTDSLTGTKYSYQYDALGRLTRSQALPHNTPVNASLAQHFDYGYSFTDPTWASGATHGNLERITTYRSDGTQSALDYQYQDDRAVNLSAPSSQSSLVYDYAGRVVQKASSVIEQFGYDIEGRLRWTTSAGSLVESLEYDPTGELMFRQPGTRAQWLVGPFATISGEVTAGCTVGNCAPSGVSVSVHILVGGARIASVRAPPSGSSTSAVPQVLYYHRDLQGSVIATTITGARVGARYRYTPYGVLDRSEVVTPGGESDLGFQGSLRLSGGLLHMRTRVYDPAVGRFFQPDAVDALRYTFVQGDPINLYDPSGRAAVNTSTPGRVTQQFSYGSGDSGGTIQYYNDGSMCAAPNQGEGYCAAGNDDANGNARDEPQAVFKIGPTLRVDTGESQKDSAATGIAIAVGVALHRFVPAPEMAGYLTQAAMSKGVDKSTTRRALVVGVVVNIVASPVTRMAIRWLGAAGPGGYLASIAASSAIGALGSIATQYYSGTELKDINWWQVAGAGLTTGVGAAVPGLEAFTGKWSTMERAAVALGYGIPAGTLNAAMDAATARQPAAAKKPRRKKRHHRRRLVPRVPVAYWGRGLLLRGAG